MDARPFVVVVPVFDGVNLMDIAAPRELFHWAAGVVQDEVAVGFFYVAADRRVRTLDGTRFRADRQFDDLDVQTSDVLWVPGGDPAAIRVQLDRGDDGVVGYARRVGTRIAERGDGMICSVCEGAVLLAATGLLDGYRATTHWNFYPCIAEDYPEVDLVAPTQEGEGFVYPRYVLDRDRLTGGGVTSGLDEALFLIEHLWGERVASTVARITQYAPSPPVHPQFGLAQDGCPVPTAVEGDGRTRFADSVPLV